MAQRVLEAIEQAGMNFVESAAQLLPRAVVTISIIVVGWFIAIILKWVTRWVLGRLGFNRLCERFELAALLDTADLPSAEALASAAVFWIVWIGFLLSGVDVLGFAVLQGLVDGFALFVPRLLIVVGWFIAIILKWVTRWVLGRLGFNRLCERFELAALLDTADLPSAEALASAAVFWIVWIGFLLSGVDVLGFTVLQGLVDGFALFVPRLLVAIAILVVGYVLANLAWRATVLAAVNAHVPSPRLLSGAVRALVLILAAAMALDQIGVARTIVLTAFAIAFGAVMLGLAIAFGVGGGGIARRILDHWFPERDSTENDEAGHL